jgi:hypothetical protein
MRMMLISVAVVAAIVSASTRNASVPHGGKGGSGVGIHNGRSVSGAHARRIGPGYAGPGQLPRLHGSHGNQYRPHPHWRGYRNGPDGTTNGDPTHPRQKSPNRFGTRVAQAAELD